MKAIQAMPDIWDGRLFWTSKTDVLGALACCAIRQSPYLFPKDLSMALTEFNSNFDTLDCFNTTCNRLRIFIRKTFDKCPTILSWNEPKRGNHQMVFMTRYSKIQPDYDFIDLDALAKNMAHMITLEAKYNQLHEEHNAD